MTRAMGAPHSAADLTARSGSVAGARFEGHSIETLVDAEIEKLNALVGPPPAIEREPEVLGGCSCGARFFSIDAAEAHACRLDDVDGAGEVLL